MSYEYDLFNSYCDDDIVRSVSDVLNRESWWIKGPEIPSLENKISRLTGREHAIAVNSGSSALYATLVCVGVSGKEVILPSFTYQATANAVIAAGGEPVFVDIEDDSYGLSATAVRDAITDRTEAIVPVHFGGGACVDICDIRTIADEADLFVLEDSAPSLGATLDGDPVGSFGHAAAFSFAFNKVITTAQGGMIVTDDPELAGDLRKFRKHGRNTDGEFDTWGMNLVMSSVHAAIGLAQLEQFDRFVDRRREMATTYSSILKFVDEVTTPSDPNNVESVHWLYNIRLPSRKQRDQLRTHLSDCGIPTKIYYEPCHITSYFREEWGYEPGDLPVTEAVSETIVTLPFHLNLSDTEIEAIAREISAFFEDTRGQ